MSSHKKRSHKRKSSPDNSASSGEEDESDPVRPRHHARAPAGRFPDRHTPRRGSRRAPPRPVQPPRVYAAPAPAVRLSRRPGLTAAPTPCLGAG